MAELGSLEHYGTKGMKWGVRRGKKTTGVSRTRGALLDRNAVLTKGIGEAQKAGAGDKSASRGGKIANTLNRVTIGQAAAERHYKTRLADITAQNARLKAGKLTVYDRLDATTQVLRTPVSLLVSARPK